MKLSSITILAVGFFIMVAALAYGFFDHWSPNKKEVGLLEANKAELENVYAQDKKAKKRADDARKMVLAKAEAWNAIARVHTPPQSLKARGIDLSVSPTQLLQDVKVFRDIVQEDMNNIVRSGKVKVIVGPEVPQIGNPESTDAVLASFFNYPAMPFPVLVFDFGAITVQGTYDEIMQHVRNYKNVTKYLAVTDGLAINGTSPNMTGTYNLTVVAFIRGDQITPQLDKVQAGSSGTAGNGGGANFGPGGRGGGMPPIPGAPGGGGIDFGSRKKPIGAG